MTFKIPRPGTRTRAVFDLIYKNEMQGKPTRWRDAKAAYDAVLPALDKNAGRFSGLAITRLLHRFAFRVARGLYEMDGDWYNTAQIERIKSQSTHAEQPTALDIHGRELHVNDLIRLDPNTKISISGLIQGKIYTIVSIGSEVGRGQHNFVQTNVDIEPVHFGMRFERVEAPFLPAEGAPVSCVSEEMHLAALVARDAEITQLQDKLAHAENGCKQLERSLDGALEHINNFDEEIKDKDALIRNQLSVIGNLKLKLTRAKDALS